MLHISDINVKKAKEKIEPFLNMVVKHFQGAFHPFQNISIYEIVIKYKGIWRNKQCNPSKPSKYHMKTFGVCDSTTGYAQNILTHFVRETSYNEDIIDATMSEKVFEYLLSPLGTGHQVFADRYYTTYKLLAYMTL